MNLLGSILCTADAEQYKALFEKHGINAHTLKSLTEEDLTILGINEAEKRVQILLHAKHLQIDAEIPVPVVIDQQFLEEVLKQSASQLRKHLAALSIAFYHKNLILSDIRVAPAAKCLEGCLDSLQKELNVFKTKFGTIKKKRSKSKYIILLTMVTCVSLGLSYNYYFKLSLSK